MLTNKYTQSQEEEIWNYEKYDNVFPICYLMYFDKWMGDIVMGYKNVARGSRKQAKNICRGWVDFFCNYTGHWTQKLFLEQASTVKNLVWVNINEHSYSHLSDLTKFCSLLDGRVNLFSWFGYKTVRHDYLIRNKWQFQF